MASKRAHETDDEDGIDIGNGKTKRLKPAKKQTVQCFRQEYTTSYPVIRKSSVASAQLAVKIDELLVDVFYYIDNCSTRLRNLKAIQVYHEVQAQKILKHVSTRWTLFKLLRSLFERFLKPVALANKSAIKLEFGSFQAHISSQCLFEKDDEGKQVLKMKRVDKFWESMKTETDETVSLSSLPGVQINRSHERGRSDLQGVL
nr:hypothetical protein BaRGS_017729 [Batillaria attramentaria]